MLLFDLDPHPCELGHHVAAGSLAVVGEQAKWDVRASRSWWTKRSAPGINSGRGTTRHPCRSDSHDSLWPHKIQGLPALIVRQSNHTQVAGRFARAKQPRAAVITRGTLAPWRGRLQLHETGHTRWFRNTAGSTGKIQPIRPIYKPASRAIFVSESFWRFALAPSDAMAMPIVGNSKGDLASCLKSTA